MSETYPDRRDVLFGREPDIRVLCDRARHAGLTVVAARPLMGKTWTLVEVARRLVEEGTFIVGYHESKGAENSHLLYAVSDLYRRWLEDSNMWAQAASLWERHKANLVPRIGQAVGAIVEKLGGTMLPDGIAALVQKSFDGLAVLKKDLDGGGQDLAPLPYNEALQLVDLVVKLGGKRVVLILDAWEKSPSITREYATLESIAKSPADWSQAHVMLAVRNPEVDSTKLNDEAWRRAQDLCRVSSSAKVYELPAMDRADPKERARIVGFVRAQVAAAKDASDERIVDMIDGYPGVLGFWLDDTTRREMRTPDDLRDQAGNAQALRYLELDHLLGELKEPALSLAARLTVFPRLDATGWKRFAGTLLADGPDDPFYALVDGGVLLDEPFPTFGHDTRYVAARRWFVEHQRPLLRRLATRIVDRLASPIHSVDSGTRPFLEALVGSSDAARELALDASVVCLIDAARSGFGDSDRLLDDAFHANALAACARTPGVAPLLAIALNNRAIENSKRSNVVGELADYEAVIALPGAPSNDVGRALSNRALHKIETGDAAGGLADFDTAVALPGMAAAPLSTILFNRGLLRADLDDTPGEIADFTRIVEMPGLSPEHVARALVARAEARRKSGDIDGAVADNTAVIALPGAPDDRVSTALHHRALINLQRRDATRLVADCTTLIDWPQANPSHVLQAHMNRGVARAVAGQHADAIADFTDVLYLPTAAPDDVARAYLNRAVTWEMLRNVDEAANDVQAASQIPGASANLVAAALSTLARLRPPPA